MHDADKDMMDNEELSVIVWCWSDLQTEATLLRMVSVATGEEVHLNSGSFLLRISIDAKASVTRCFIRHIASGREAYIQGGPNLRAFVKDCLLNTET
jgi:hypothetical protein